MLLFLLFMLPLLEIAGFIVIGGRIGVGSSLLWVIFDVIAGFWLLTAMGAATLNKAKASVKADVYPFEEMFDGFCIIFGAALLIFPGFISDFIALPLLFPPSRRLIFLFLKTQHDSILKDLSKKSQGFTYWYYEEHKTGATPGKTIEGEFRREDDDKKLR
jgi:UPF0716 family protein affecting phage T7 exclusion